MGTDLDAAAPLRATPDLLCAESLSEGVGANLVTGRLADVLFVHALRAWSEVATDSPGWLAALRHPGLARSIKAMHADLARPWTVGALARRAGMSRSAYAAEFRERTGETPLGYLTAWRVRHAKELLRDTPLSLFEIATRVGHQTDTALSRAFRRREGVAPGAWRTRRRQHPLSGRSAPPSDRGATRDAGSADPPRATGRCGC